MVKRNFINRALNRKRVKKAFSGRVVKRNYLKGTDALEHVPGYGTAAQQANRIPGIQGKNKGKADGRSTKVMGMRFKDNKWARKSRHQKN